MEFLESAGTFDGSVMSDYFSGGSGGMGEEEKLLGHTWVSALGSEAQPEYRLLIYARFFRRKDCSYFRLQALGKGPQRR